LSIIAPSRLGNRQNLRTKRQESIHKGLRVIPFDRDVL
jgi:hypothetical protein